MRTYQMRIDRRALSSLANLTGATLAFGILVGMPAWPATFTFTTGAPDSRLGALSRRASPRKLETETADDFILQQTTVINRATITGLVPLGTLRRISKRLRSRCTTSSLWTRPTPPQ